MKPGTTSNGGEFRMVQNSGLAADGKKIFFHLLRLSNSTLSQAAPIRYPFFSLSHIIVTPTKK